VGLGWRPKPDGYQFHSREPLGSKMAGRLSRDCGGQMHLQFSAWRRLIAKHKPDLVWIDPLLSYIGDDISKQSVCSQFLRNWRFV
jgi:hypothetical protein